MNLGPVELLILFVLLVAVAVVLITSVIRRR
jgi:hypothetical protein